MLLGEVDECAETISACGAEPIKAVFVTVSILATGLAPLFKHLLGSTTGFESHTNSQPLLEWTVGGDEGQVVLDFGGGGDNREVSGRLNEVGVLEPARLANGFDQACLGVEDIGEWKDLVALDFAVATDEEVVIDLLVLVEEVDGLEGGGLVRT